MGQAQDGYGGSAEHGQKRASGLGDEAEPPLSREGRESRECTLR